MSEEHWHDLGDVHEFSAPITPVRIGRLRLAVTNVNGEFGVINGVCNHMGGPLGEGRIDGEYVVCPWHNWKYHVRTGKGEPGYEADSVPSHEVQVDDGHLYVNLTPATQRTRGEHAPHPLARKPVRADGPYRVLGISTTNMDEANPRFSTSQELLETSLRFAHTHLLCETKMLRLSALKFRPCEGYYSKNARACTWPCSITQMDPNDEMEQVYEGMVHWADIVLVATPIRWGAASALYYRMAERLNCVQNQVTVANRVLLHNKVAGFIITGGQDNVQAVAGQLMGFFTEIGFYLPQFPYIAHSRGWSAEDMEHNVEFVRSSPDLHEAAESLVQRAVDMSRLLIEHQVPGHFHRAGRKADGMERRELPVVYG